MSDLVKDISDAQKKPAVVDVRSGDTVRVYQQIKEGNKTRVQMFEGVVIRTDRKNSLTSRITVRRVASGIGVEKSYLLHSPLVEKVEIIKRGKVRRNYLTFLRNRFGKSARLVGKPFDKSINDVDAMVAKANEGKVVTEESSKEPVSTESQAEKAEIKTEE